MIKSQEEFHREMHDILDTVRKAGSDLERNAIIQELRLLQHEIPENKDLHYTMGMSAGIARCLAHIERRK